jgi:hypothetical protein
MDDLVGQQGKHTNSSTFGSEACVVCISQIYLQGVWDNYEA